MKRSCNEPDGFRLGARLRKGAPGLRIQEGRVKSLPMRLESSVRKERRREATENENNAILELVRDGVRRFVLKDAPIGDFQKAIRAAARMGKSSSHPLTGSVFRKIVKAAIRERKRGADRAKL